MAIEDRNIGGIWDVIKYQLLPAVQAITGGGGGGGGASTIANGANVAQGNTTDTILTYLVLRNTPTSAATIITLLKMIALSSAAEGSAYVSGQGGSPNLVRIVNPASPPTYADNEIRIPSGDRNGALLVNIDKPGQQTEANSVPVVLTALQLAALTPLPISGFGLTPFRNTALTNAAQQIKATAGRIHGINFINPNASAVYVKFYNSLSAGVTVGSTAVVKTYIVPASGALCIEPQFLPIVNFSTAISLSCVTTLPDAGAAAPVSAIHVEVDYV